MSTHDHPQALPPPPPPPLTPYSVPVTTQLSCASRREIGVSLTALFFESRVSFNGVNILTTRQLLKYVKLLISQSKLEKSQQTRQQGFSSQQGFSFVFSVFQIDVWIICFKASSTEPTFGHGYPDANVSVSDHHQCFRKIQVYTLNFISLVESLYTTRGPQDRAPIHHTERQTYCIIISSFRSYLASVLKKVK